jgi:Flp pilus assembly protein TadG
MVRRRKNERGFALVMVAISATTLLGFLALAIDLGRLAFTANEVQTVADVAATAGATYLMAGQDPTTARSQVRTVVAQNRVAGVAASIPQDSDIQVGQYAPQTNTFTNGASPYNAVRATPSATITNQFMGMFGASYQTSTVTKTATAGFSGLGQAAPTLPLVIKDCSFPSLQACFGDSSCLPRLTLQPDGGQNSCWSSLTDPSSNKPNVEQYFPSACGGSQTPPVVTVGGSVNLNLTNGTINPLVDDVATCLSKGIDTFLVPIVACSSNCNQAAAITGFATVQLSNVQNHSFTVKALFNDVSGPTGGAAYGTGKMRLFN